MSKYAQLQEWFDNCTPEEKLQILGSEMRLPITVVHGYARLLKGKITSDNIDTLPDDFEEMLERIIQAGDDLQELFDMMRGKTTME